MSISSIGSLVMGFTMLLIAFVIEGGSDPSKLKALGSLTSAMIVFGGTSAAVGLSFPSSELKRLPKILGVAFKNRKSDIPELIKYFKNIAVKTRREGLLSIEEEISKSENVSGFVKKGLQLIVDGVEPQTVKSVLESEAYITSERHKAGAEIFGAAGGFSPTLGIIGTVMGLVNVLAELAHSSPDKLGESISTCFIATLYGVASANLIFLPIGNKLKALNKEEDMENELIIEAILSIQEGLNPNTLEEKLKGFLNKQELIKYESMSGSGEKVE